MNFYASRQCVVRISTNAISLPVMYVHCMRLARIQLAHLNVTAKTDLNLQVMHAIAMVNYLPSSQKFTRLSEKMFT